jgi:hypothetical protein
MENQEKKRRSVISELELARFHGNWPKQAKKTQQLFFVAVVFACKKHRRIIHYVFQQAILCCSGAAEYRSALWVCSGTKL